MTELVVVSAADEAALIAELGRIVAFLDRVPMVSLVDVAYTCSRQKGPSVLSVIADSVPDLRARLASAQARLTSGTGRRLRDKSGLYYFKEHLLGPDAGKLAFIFPGVPSFYPDMMSDLTISNPICRGAFDELEEAMAGDDEFTPSSFIFPPAPHYREDANVFRSGAYAQALVATYSACVAMTRLLRSMAILPQGVVGFAGGDLAAMRTSGAAGLQLPRAERVTILREIYKIVYQAVNHGGLPTVVMVSTVLRHPEDMEPVLSCFTPEQVCLAVDFSPRQKTYSVVPEAVEAFEAALAEAGIRSMRLQLDRPFNTPLCASLVPSIRKFTRTWMRTKPVHEAFSCAKAERFSPELKYARDEMAECWVSPVRFGETLRAMYDAGYRVFLEVGPRSLMTGAVEDTLKGEDFAALATNSIHRSGLLQLQHAVAQLVALGAEADLSSLFANRKVKFLDFDSVLSLEVRRESEMRLSRRFPTLTLLLDGTFLQASSMVQSGPAARGNRAAVRAAVVAHNARRQRQFDFGAMNPLVSDADVLDSRPTISLKVRKVFRLRELPFIADFALGASQISYADPNLKGLVLLSLPLATEIMGEVAQQVFPRGFLSEVHDLKCRRLVPFQKGELELILLAERVASGDPALTSVHVRIWEASTAPDITDAILEATFLFAEAERIPEPIHVAPLVRPRSVHWSERDIYPQRLCYGKRLRGIHFVDCWGEDGLDYEITIPYLAENILSTRFPVWAVNPLLMGSAAEGFQLWRSHERFEGAFSFPFRLRRLRLARNTLKEGSPLKCYMRHTGVTPQSQICDIFVTDGNGKELMSLSGWEELTERYPVDYRNLIFQPATTFVSEPLSQELMGTPATDVSAAVLTDIPYPIFARNEEIWLKTISQVVLGASERRPFAEMTGSTNRRTEWLFGRVAAKEAVRRYLKEFHQARWCDADIQIWADDSGKPHALGAWSQYLKTRLDIAIAHTQQFIVAVAASNARVGVDVESVSRNLSEEFTAGVFTPEELELAAHSSNAAVAIIRFWCAKEALSKALGTGIRYAPKALVVTGYETDSGHLTMQLTGPWLDAFKSFRGRDIPITVRTFRDHALAFCFLSESLFAHES